MHAIGRLDWVPTKHSVVCSKHFRNEEFDRTSPLRIRLREGAVPITHPAVQVPEDVTGSCLDPELNGDSTGFECADISAPGEQDEMSILGAAPTSNSDATAATPRSAACSSVAPNAPVHIVGTVTQLPPGLHSFTVHTNGNLAGGCKAAQVHFNPDCFNHGAPNDTERHVGDLGNIMANSNGAATIDMWDSAITLNGGRTIIGRSIVVHEGMDDLGRGGNPESLKSGNSGPGLGCCVISAVGSPGPLRLDLPLPVPMVFPRCPND